MDIRGRIPGRAGLWQLSCDEAAVIRSLSCVDPGFAGTRCDWITPGLFDLQINGISGISFGSPTASAEEFARADQAIRARGVSRYCPTIITCSADTARSALGTLRSASEKGTMPGAWGVHMEGPWLSPEEGYRGVHRREHIRLPDPKELERFQEWSGGRVRLLTVAPEREGSEALIRQAVKTGITVSLGHTNATPADVAHAVRAGARLSTHLFNGCARLQDRHANVIYAQLAEDALVACFIADGHHVPYPTLKIGLRAKGLGRSVLVSDLAHLSGLPDGEYEMEGNAVDLRDGGIWVKGSYLLSGAARTLDKDVELLARQEEPGIEHALLMATRNPAAAVGDPAWAELAARRRGPIAVFSWDGTSLTLRERIGF